MLCRARRLFITVFALGMSVVLAGEFTRALPGYRYQFPRDHGQHPDFRTEWWYFVGNVRSDAGARFGYELTFFRTATTPPGDPVANKSPLVAGQIYFAHFAISTIERETHRSWERIGRVGFGQCSASEEGLDLRIGPWRAVMDADETITLRAEAGAGAINLRLDPAKPPVIHGADGVHQKAADPGQASHYVSFTRLATSGTLQWEGETHRVEGGSWMDHEFGSDQLGEEEVGWDWFALQLETGEELMVYQIRRADGSAAPFSAGTLVAPDGAGRSLRASDYQIEPTGQWQSPESGAVYPMGWIVTLPAQQARLTITPAFEAQEMQTTRTTGTTYWEGTVTITGQWRDQPAEGQGYVELVGYSGRFSKL